MHCIEILEWQLLPTTNVGKHAFWARMKGYDKSKNDRRRRCVQTRRDCDLALEYVMEKNRSLNKIHAGL